MMKARGANTYLSIEKGANTLWGTALPILAMAGMLTTSAVAEEPTAEVKDGVFIHISHGKDDPHRLLMALKMAEIMCGERDVLVYLDIKAVEVALKGAADFSFSHFPSSNTQIENLLAAGVTIQVCPGCLKAAGKTPEDVRAGVQIADKDAFFSFTKRRPDWR